MALQFIQLVCSHYCYIHILRPFDGFFSRTTWISRYQKGRTILDFNEARDDGRQWHQLDHTNHLHLAPDNHASTSSALRF